MAVALDVGSAVTATPGCVRLSVRAQPRSSRNAVIGAIDDGHGGVALKIAVTAPPVEGAANAAIVALLSKVLGVPRRDVVVIAGEGGRSKVVQVEGVDAASAVAALRAAIAR